MNTPEPALAIDISEHRRNPGAMPPVPLVLPGVPGGAALRPLRHLDDGTLRAGIVDLPEDWAIPDGLRATGVVQLFVLEGLLLVDESPLRRYGYVAVPQGARVPRLRCPEPVRAILILDAGAILEPGRATATTSARVLDDALAAVTPIVPVVAGRVMEGFERRVLWLEEATGADTRLLRIPGGFEGSGPGWHPVHEEIFLLEGDVAPDDSRRMEPGDYLWNPARSVHGFHEHSRTGCLLLEWHDGLWAYNPWSAPPVRDTRGQDPRR